MIILAFISTGPYQPKVSNIFAISDNTGRFVGFRASRRLTFMVSEKGSSEEDQRTPRMEATCIFWRSFNFVEGPSQSPGTFDSYFPRLKPPELSSWTNWALTSRAGKRLSPPAQKSSTCKILRMTWAPREKRCCISVVSCSMVFRVRKESQLVP